LEADLDVQNGWSRYHPEIVETAPEPELVVRRGRRKKDEEE
jgi:hypothetical protein